MEQKEGVIVVANPGTGKTAAIADKVVDLLKSGVSEEKILCITFTNKAAAEMRDRIEAKIRESGLSDVKPYKLSIHTFHSFTYDYLLSLGENYNVINNNAIRFSIFKSFQRNKALNYSKEYIISEIVPKSENAIRYLKSFGILPKDIDIKKVKEELIKTFFLYKISSVTLEENLAFLEYFVKAYEDYENLKPKNSIDYNDMLLEFIKRYDGSRKHYSYVLVDELQDLNELEADIAVGVGDKLFMVGDRKQAIFGFQGGSLRNFNRLRKMAGMEESKKDKNYRSSKEVLDYAKEYFLSNTSDKSYEEELSGLRNQKDIKGEVGVVVSNDPFKAALKKALSLLGPDGKRCAIITRTNFQLLHLSRLLDSKGVEYTTTISASVSDEAKESILSFLRGLLYDDTTMVINALFTPFSGVSLREAFQISEANYKNKMDLHQIAIGAPSFFGLREGDFSIVRLKSIFDRVILPISVSIGKDYYVTAAAILRNVDEFFMTFENPTRDDLFDYISTTEDNYEVIGEEKQLVLTTVHKAKGLEFDNVIYVPKKIPDKFSFIDTVVYSIIKSQKGIDIKEELAEEYLRVDFVAFTRAKEKLYIVTKSDLEEAYHIPGRSTKEVDFSEIETEPISKKYDEAYSLFVNRRYEEAKTALEKEEIWLKSLIFDYFKNIRSLSYSLVEGIKDPFYFLKNNILKLKKTTYALEFGSEIHTIAEKLFNGGLEESELSEEQMSYLGNIRSIIEEIKHKFNAAQIYAEKQINLPLKGFVRGYEGNMSFTSKIDAIFKYDSGKYVILDYKTDRNVNRAGDHRRQLAVYKKALSMDENIKEEDISVAIGFIGLRGNINTKKLGLKLDAAQPRADQVNTFENHAKYFLSLVDSPELFIKELLDKPIENDVLYRQVSNVLKSELNR